MSLYRLIRPILFQFDAEQAHGLALKALKSGLVPSKKTVKVSFSGLRTDFAGLNLSGPVGLAAGFDKNAEVAGKLSSFGFGFVEAGTVTKRPQKGNDKPRLFRLVEDEAVINRMGFNNDGLDQFKVNIAKAKAEAPELMIGANLGINKDSEDAVGDYVYCLEQIWGMADYFTVNISSPNTPGLRDIQAKEQLNELVKALKESQSRLQKDRGGYYPIFVKVAPDLSDEQCQDIAEVALELGVDGLIVSNTTIALREGLQSEFKDETGGLSGKPLFDLATERLSLIYKLTQGRVPLIGVGGIATAEQAYAKIKAGASAIQLYSALVYQGLDLVQDINEGLAALMIKDGYRSIAEVVGADHKE